MDIRDDVKAPFWVAWAFCAASLLAVAVMAVRVGTHPLAESGHGYFFFGLPHLVIAASAWPARRGGVSLLLLAVLAGVAGVIGVASAFGEMDLTLFVLNARAAGRKAMSCGPPPILFYIPVGFVMTLLA